jgi:Rieske Fe-S protein
MQALTRQSALRGSVVAVVGAVAGYLAARNTTAARAPRGATVANAYGPPPGDEGGGGGGGGMLVSVDRVPVGGGVVLGKQKVVVTRPAPGDVRAFSAVCTHQGCTVGTVADGRIDCPCHGSSFDATTGAVRNGPATRPLTKVAVVVRSGKVFTS